jgi:hypothetical protein
MKHRYLLLVYSLILDCLLVGLTYGLTETGRVVDEEGACLVDNDTKETTPDQPLSEGIETKDPKEGAVPPSTNAIEGDDDDLDDDEEEEEDERDWDDQDEWDYTLRRDFWSKPQRIFVKWHDAIDQSLITMNEYMNRFMDEETSLGKYKCRNNDGECSYWAVIGECDADNRDYSK